MSDTDNNELVVRIPTEIQQQLEDEYNLPWREARKLIRIAGSVTISEDGVRQAVAMARSYRLPLRTLAFIPTSQGLQPYVTADGYRWAFRIDPRGCKYLRSNILEMPNEGNDQTCLVKVTIGFADGGEFDAHGAASSQKTGRSKFAREDIILLAECVPLNSEILTRDGWKTYDAAIIGEEVLAFDSSTNTTKWTPLLDISVHGPLDMVEMGYENETLFTCTPNHKWVTSKMHNKEITELTELWDINTNDSIWLAAPYEDSPTIEMSEMDASIIGWLITDGSIRKSRVGICQSKEDMVDKIRDMLDKSPYSYYEVVTAPYTRTFPSGKTYDCKAQHWFYLNMSSARKLLSKYNIRRKEDVKFIAARIPEKARKAMLESMMDADGSRRTFNKKSADIFETWQILVTLEGTALGKMRRDSQDSVNVQHMKTVTKVNGSNLVVRPVEREEAWCPTTKYGTWVMRQNGRVAITGNTKAIRRALINGISTPFPIFEDALDVMDRGIKATDKMNIVDITPKDLGNGDPTNMVEVIKRATVDKNMSLDEIKTVLNTDSPFTYENVEEAWRLIDGSE